MFRFYWQTIMIALARSGGWKGFMQSRRTATGLARRYVAGGDVAAAIAVAKALRKDGITCSAFYLGEYVDRYDLVQETMAAKRSAIAAFAAEGLDVHVSVDPTQVGCAVDWEAGAGNVADLAGFLTRQTAGGPGRHCLMLDMEDFSVNSRTILLHDMLAARGDRVGVTLQAYLHKTTDDLRGLIGRGAMVRLVKGAFAADRTIALTSAREIRQNYKRLIDQMLHPDAREYGFYPVFGTHDDGLHEYAIEVARSQGWRQGEYEFEMLYGARMDLARHLALSGEAIRLYLPFGVDWWPYAVRRIGENPRNARLLIRGLMGR